MNEKKQLCYDMITAYSLGIQDHPIQQMKNLGYKIIAGVPQTIGDCWWFTVQDVIYPLPKYLSKMQYDFDYWHGDGNG